TIQTIDQDNDTTIRSTEDTSMARTQYIWSKQVEEEQNMQNKAHYNTGETYCKTGKNSTAKGKEMATNNLRSVRIDDSDIKMDFDNNNSFQEKQDWQIQEKQETL
ncbi:13040_t:CDS:2, partial [Acaulospora colombiana]